MLLQTVCLYRVAVAFTIYSKNVRINLLLFLIFKIKNIATRSLCGLLVSQVSFRTRVCRETCFMLINYYIMMMTMNSMTSKSIVWMKYLFFSCLLTSCCCCSFAFLLRTVLVWKQNVMIWTLWKDLIFFGNIRFYRLYFQT